jgi:hypothetical protein
MQQVLPAVVSSQLRLQLGQQVNMFREQQPELLEKCFGMAQPGPQGVLHKKFIDGEAGECSLL